MRSVLNDVRVAARNMASAPAFAAVAVFTLAVGIAANTTIFSAVHAFLLEPLPYPDSDKLAAVYTSNSVTGWTQTGHSMADFVALRDQTQSANVAAYVWDDMNVADDRGQPVRLSGMGISGNFFEVLGIPPILGRAPNVAEETEGGTPAAVISHGLWQRRYGSNPDVLGELIELDGTMHRIVGVAAPDFWFQALDIEVWAGFQLSEDALDRANGRFIFVIARANPDAPAEAMHSEIAAVGTRLAADFPDYNKANEFFAVRYRDAVFDEEFKVGSAIALVAVAFVLLIACANVANLLLARAMGRSREVAVRTALGATRGRIIRQLLTEASLVATLGGIAGVLLSIIGINALVSIIPPETPGIRHIGLNGISLTFAVAITMTAAVLFGLAPALQGSSVHLSETLKDGGRGGTGLKGGRLRKVLVVAEVALAMVLLVSSGLLVKGYFNLRAAERGFDETGVLSLRVSVTGSRYPGNEEVTRFFRDALDRVRRVPGVSVAAAVDRMPMGGWSAVGYSLVGEAEAEGQRQPRIAFHRTTAGFFEALQVPLRFGRELAEDDMEGGAPVAVVNETFTKRHFEDPAEAIGRILKVGETEHRIVGVAQDMAYGNTMIRPTMFIPASLAVWRNMSFLVRGAPGSAADSDPHLLAGSIRAAIEEVDPTLPVYDVITLRESILERTQGDAIMGRVMAVLGLVALLLSVVGVYGVMAYNVQQRVQEVGIRMALGARTRDVLGLIMKQGMGLAGIGVIIGLGLSLAATRGLSTFLFGVSPFDAATFASVTGTLLGAALLASFLPARRSARVDPNEALRVE